MTLNLIEAFESIRDIPYRIPLSMTEEDNCCSGKAIRLKKILEAHGYDVRYRVCSFSWKESFNLPRHIEDIPHDDASTHVYLEVKIETNWINVDPTWDVDLKDILDITHWDGMSNTPVAVRSITLFDDETSRKIMEESSDEDAEKDLDQNGKFYAALNDWFEENRKTTMSSG